MQLLGDKQAVQVLFDEVAPRFLDRPGGYTRILKLATPRLGDAGARAIIEFVGVHDRIVAKSEKPAFGGQDDTDDDAKETADPVGDDMATEAEGSEADGAEAAGTDTAVEKKSDE